MFCISLEWLNNALFGKETAVCLGLGVVGKFGLDWS